MLTGPILTLLWSSWLVQVNQPDHTVRNLQISTVTEIKLTFGT